MSILRFGIISFAHAHVRAYADVMRDFDDAKIVAAWDDDHARGRQYCELFGLDLEPQLDGLLARPELDAVFIASPTSQHAAHCIAAARAGKHILLQKPMALSLADCDAIAAAVQESGVKFSLCYQMRADPVNQKMKALLDEGVIGKVAILRRRHAIPMLLNPEFAYAGNWHIDPAQNMGMFMDDASHAADWMYWMLGAPVSVMAEIDNIVTDVAPDDNGIAVYRFPGRELGILPQQLHHPGSRKHHRDLWRPGQHHPEPRRFAVVQCAPVARRGSAQGLSRGNQRLEDLRLSAAAARRAHPRCAAASRRLSAGQARPVGDGRRRTRVHRDDPRRLRNRPVPAAVSLWAALHNVLEVT